MGDKVYNQSHYTGRTGMVSIGKELTLAVRVKQKFKRKRSKDNRPPRESGGEQSGEDTLESLPPRIPPSRRAVSGRHDLAYTV